MFTGRLYGFWWVMSASPIRIRPAVGSSNPDTIRSVVVLPQPEGPSRAKKDPWGTCSDKSFTALKSPNDFVRFSRNRSPSALVMSVLAMVVLPQPWITRPKDSEYSAVSSGVSGRNTCDWLKISSVGKIHSLSASLGSILRISSCAPLTGQT